MGKSGDGGGRSLRDSIVERVREAGDGGGDDASPTPAPAPDAAQAEAAEGVREIGGADAALGDVPAAFDGDTDAGAEDAWRAGMFASRSGRRRRLQRSYNDVRRAVFMVLFLPVALAVAIGELVHAVRERRSGGARPATPAFRRPASMPRGAARSVADVMGQLRRFPFRPLPLNASMAFYREFGADGIGTLLSPSMPSLVTAPHPYPSRFKPRLFTCADGEPVSGLQAMHDRPGPALVICHGVMTNKHFDYIRQIARRAFEDWGFHVVLMDLRGFGQSSWTTQAPSSAGYVEGRDVVELARHLHGDDRVTSVGVLGFSLGGCTALNAARHASLEDDSPLDGGVCAVSAPTDMKVAVDYVTKRPSWRHPFFGMWLVFRTALRSGARFLEIDEPVREWPDLVRAHSLPYYKVTEEEFLRRASAAYFADDITTPTLALHAADDFIVPVDHAYRLREAAADNPNLDVWVVDKGSHCSFSAVDSRWYNSVLRRWFEYWASETPATRRAPSGRSEAAAR